MNFVLGVHCSQLLCMTIEILLQILFQGNAARYAELKEAQVNYRGDSVDLIHYYIVSSKFAKKHSDWKQLDGKWKVQVVLDIH